MREEYDKYATNDVFRTECKPQSMTHDNKAWKNENIKIDVREVTVQTENLRNKYIRVSLIYKYVPLDVLYY